MINIRLIHILILLKLFNYVKPHHISESLNISEDELNTRLDKLFCLIDKDHNNILDRDEVVNYFNNISLLISEKQIDSELAQIDTNGDGVVSFDELHETLLKTSAGEDQTKYVESLRKRFHAADKDKSGTLNSHELSLLINPGKDEVLMEIDVQEVFENHDVDRDGKITLDEFKETSGQDFTTSETEFSFFDIDANGYLDQNEVRQIYINETTESLEGLEDFFTIVGDGEITKKIWDDNRDEIAISSLTDYGEVLRHSEDYHLDIGKNINIEKNSEL